MTTTPATTTTTSTSTTTSAETLMQAGVMVKIPPFWPQEPDLWFCQIESQFVMRNITRSITKYHHVISALSNDVLIEIRDIISDPALPTSDDPYSTLKKAIIDRISQSEGKRLNLLLSAAEMGDRRPSQFLRYLQGLLGDKAHKFDPAMLKQLFLTRLPAHVQQVLAASGQNELDKLADLADKMLEVSVPAVNKIHTESGPATTHDNLQAQINALTQKFDQFLSTQNERDRSRSRSRSRSRQRVNSNLCWYHDTFGNNARKCVQPCQWIQSGRSNTSTNSGNANTR